MSLYNQIYRDILRNNIYDNRNIDAIIYTKSMGLLLTSVKRHYRELSASASTQKH